MPGNVASGLNAQVSRSSHAEGPSAPSAGMMFSTGYPTLLGSTAFSTATAMATATGGAALSPPLFSASRDASAMSLGGSPTAEADIPSAFTSDDRMLLRMIYHQQQAIQVQLSTLTTWMQHVSGRLAGLERHAKGARSVAPAPAPAVAVEALAASASNQPPPQQASQQQQHQQAPSSTGPSHAVQSSVAAASSACTPPGDGIASGMNRSVDSVGGVWDPSARRPEQQPPLMRTSRASSQLGRRENPLLSASANDSGVQRPASVTSSVLESSVDHTLLDSQGAYTASGSVNGVLAGHGYAREEARQPPVLGRPQGPYISTSAVAGAMSAAPAGTMARALSDRDIPGFRHVERSKDRTTAFADPLAATSALLQRSGRPRGFGAVMPPSQSQGLTQAIAAAAPRAQTETHTQAQPLSTAATAATAATAQARATSSAATPTSSSYPRGAPSRDPSSRLSPAGVGMVGGTGRARAAPEPHSSTIEEAVRRLDADMDSDDGYGSYDSRQYMKKVGLL